MPDLNDDFFPLFDEDSASVRARMDADANAGLTTDDPEFLDTREGSFYYDATQPAVLELARLWDVLAVEVPAAAFPQFAWGDYLDNWAEVFGLARKEAVEATGEVLFLGLSGTLVSNGSTISADAPTEDGEAIEYVTTDGGTISGGIAHPSSVISDPQPGGGTLPASTYHYEVTAVSAFGETQGSGDLAVVLGATGHIGLSWPAIPGAVVYRIYRGTTAGAKARIGEVAVAAFSDTALGNPTISGPPTEDFSAGVRLPVRASDAGTEGNVAAFAISNMETPNPGVRALANEDATAGGTDTETDEALRARVLLEFGGSGAGTVNDYLRWALAYPGVGRADVVPAWAGPGTVLVIIMDALGHALSGATVAGLQSQLDPAPGLGAGLAPIGATVTVATPAPVNIDVSASITHLPGYSLDGTGGTIATRPLIEAAIARYLDSLGVGDDVVYEHVKATLFVEGVLSVSTVSVNGGTADIAVSASPAQIAQFNSATLA